MKKDTFTKTMSDGFPVVIHRWIPDGEIKGIVQLSHGMAEYAERYDEFGSLLAENGILFYAEDKRGHGDTADLAEKNGNGKFGYLADKNGFFRVRDDLHEETLDLKKEYPGKKIILFAHSFGSFVGQAYMEAYGNDIDGCILCGSAGPRLGLMSFAKIFGRLSKVFVGPKNVSKFLNLLAFGSYNSKISQKRTVFDWLSRDNENVDKYIEDRRCGFLCTVSFFNDMFDGLLNIHKSENMKKIPQNLPVHIIAGTGDPVGDYCKTLDNLYSIYLKNGIKEVDFVKYTDARHELLNETNREEVKAELLKWINARF